MTTPADVRPAAVVTGATGFIGAHLCRHLLAEGWRVGVIERAAFFPGRLGGDTAGEVAFHALENDIGAMRAFLDGFAADVVFHVAGYSVGDHAPEDVDPLLDANIACGTRLLEAMRASPTRLFVATGSFWQNADPATTDYRPANLYAATKEAFEKILAHYTRAEGMRALSLRLFDTYAETDPRTRLVNLLARSALAGSRLSLSPGEQVLSPVHVDDIVRAYVRAYELLRSASPDLAPVYGIAGPVQLDLRGLVALFERISGRTLDIGWGERPYRRCEVMLPQPGYPVLPGWTPRVSLEEGLRRVWRFTVDRG